MKGATSGSVTIDDSSFYDEVPVFIWSGTTSIVGSTFSKSTGTAIFVHSSAVTVKNNSVIFTQIGSNNDPAIVVTSSSLNLANLVGDSLSGTGNVGFQIDGTLGTSGTLPAESYPWEIGLAELGAGTVGSVTVPSGVTLSISAGTIVKSWSGTIAVQGTLSAVGTTSEPISSCPSTMTLWVERTIQVARHTPTGWGIVPTGSGSINLTNAVVDYAQLAIQ